MTTVSGLLGLAVQTPIGAVIDATRWKRGIIVAALAMLGTSAVVIYAVPRFWPVMIANTLISVVGDVFGPAISALTLGLCARTVLARRMGRNAAFDHAGNVAIAAAAGGVGWAFSQRSVFLLVPIFAALSSAAVLSIPSAAIDHARTRRGCRDTDRAAFALARAERLPALAHFRLLRAAVSSFQRAFAAAGRPEACRGVQGCSDRHDVGVHYRRATHHAADRDRSWPERRPCRAQADPAHWVRRVAATRGALHVLRSDLVADRRPVARRSGRGHFSARSRRW